MLECIDAPFEGIRGGDGTEYIVITAVYDDETNKYYIVFTSAEQIMDGCYRTQIAGYDPDPDNGVIFGISTAEFQLIREFIRISRGVPSIYQELPC